MTNPARMGTGSRTRPRDIKAEAAELGRRVDGRTLCGAFDETARRHGDRQALVWTDGAGQRSLTWREYREQVRDAALGLHALGLSPGQTVVTLLPNRPEHTVADLAALHMRATPISLYLTSSAPQVAHVINDCAASIAVVDEGNLERLRSIRGQLRSVDRVVVVGAGRLESADWIVRWEDVLAAGRAASREQPRRFEETWRLVDPKDHATLIYTSGTTGPAKGVIHTHRTIIWTIEAMSSVADVGPDDRFVSYLPMAHSAERWWSHARSVLRGASTYFCPTLQDLVPTMLRAQPTWFIGMPRVWEKLLGYVLSSEREAQSPDARKELEDAIAIGREVVAHDQEGVAPPAELVVRHARVQPRLASLLARAGLGQCRVAVSGGAPISTETLEFFHALGLRISEGWGMSEVMAGIWNGIERIKIGTVGTPLPGLEANIAPDGELLVRSEHVTPGYFRDEQLTRETITAERWLRTGDLVEVDGEGYFRISGRKKEMIITSGGKNIATANLESLLTRDRLVRNACVIGDRRPYVCALLVIDQDVAQDRLGARGVRLARDEVANTGEVREEVERIVAAANAQLAQSEQVKRFVILSDDWGVEGGELTPTLKLRRSVIADKYADVIEAMYQAR